MSDARSTTNGNPGDTYASVPLQPIYAPPAINGSNKRGRDEDDQEHTRPSSGGDGIDTLKRRKTAREGSISAPTGTTFDRDVRPLSRPRNNLMQRTR